MIIDLRISRLRSKGRDTPKRPKRSATVLTALVVVAAAVAVAAAAASSRDGAVRLHSAPSRAVSGRLGRVFSVLNSSHRAADSTAARTRFHPLQAGVVVGLGSAHPGVDASQAVFAGGTYPTWVVPGSTEVCLVVGTIGPRSVPSAVCAPITRAESGLALMTETDSGQPLVLGLAPDGNTMVKVTNVDGTTGSVPVSNNVYQITSGKPETVSLKAAGGALTTRSVAMSAPPLASAPAR